MSYSQVYNLDDGRMIGYLGDLTLLGAMVISDQAVPQDKHLTISIELPELPGSHEHNMLISARVVWCHRDLSPDYYNVGLEFNGTNEKQKSIIQAVVDNYEFRRQTPGYPSYYDELGDK